MKAAMWPLPLMAGLIVEPLPWAPTLDWLTSEVLAGQVAVTPAQVSRTKTSSRLFVSLATRVVALEAKATNSTLLLRCGVALRAFPGVMPSVATETSVVAGVQPLPTPVQASRRKVSWMPPVGVVMRLVAVEEKVKKRPSSLSMDCELTLLPAVVPSGLEMSEVEAVQVVTFTQVERTKIC